ncbi:MAG: hypothetical protein KC501_11330, partial [Myxococcales bacterium]|nr:hypothetical protein [Myxococcales bacterium]
MDQPAAIAPLDRAALRRWLLGPQVLSDDGRVWSWHNPEHPGYAYPEAGGLWLALLAREPELDDAPLRRVAAWLEACEARGPLGRDGRGYLFDRGMVVAGRLALLARGHGSPHRLRPAVLGLLDDLGASRAATPAAPDQRWSERFGPHLLKLALPLGAWLEHASPAEHARTHERLRELLHRLPVPDPEGRVPTGAEGKPTYLHAHCYAAEGLWALSAAPLPAELRARA